MHQSNFLQKCFIQSQDIHDLSKVIASSSYMKQPSINCHTVNSIPSVQDIANHLHRSQFTNLLDFTSSSSSYPAGYSSKLPLFTSKSQKPYSFLKSFNPNIFRNEFTSNQINRLIQEFPQKDGQNSFLGSGEAGEFGVLAVIWTYLFACYIIRLMKIS
ncbi:unnamed protein product [Heterobilharzia americana]|nr:unnamed protein product [Heterobilharzia americana]